METDVTTQFMRLKSGERIYFYFHYCLTDAIESTTPQHNSHPWIFDRAQNHGKWDSACLLIVVNFNLRTFWLLFEESDILKNREEFSRAGIFFCLSG